MLLTALFNGMSPTFEYLRTHRFVNKDNFLKRVAALTVREKSSALLNNHSELKLVSTQGKSRHSKQYHVIDCIVGRANGVIQGDWKVVFVAEERKKKRRRSRKLLIIHCPGGEVLKKMVMTIL